MCPRGPMHALFLPSRVGSGQMHLGENMTDTGRVSFAASLTPSLYDFASARRLPRAEAQARAPTELSRWFLSFPWPPGALHSKIAKTTSPEGRGAVLSVPARSCRLEREIERVVSLGSSQFGCYMTSSCTRPYQLSLEPTKASSHSREPCLFVN